MARRKRRFYRRYPKYYRAKHKRGFPSIASIMAVAGPQVVVNSGQLGSYPAINNAMSGNWEAAAWNFAANEIMAFTGYDVGKGSFNIGPPALTYGMPILIRFIRKFTGRVKAGPVTLL